MAQPPGGSTSLTVGTPDTRVEKPPQEDILIDIPFNKPLNRVSVEGGIGERFNYNTQAWEPNHHGKYKLHPAVRLKHAAMRALTSGRSSSLNELAALPNPDANK